MSSVRSFDKQKLRTRRIIATAALTVVAVAFLLYRSSVVLVSSLSQATASLRVDGPGTVAPTTPQVEAETRPDRGAGADRGSASEMSRPEPSPAPQPGVSSRFEDPSASEQRIFRSRTALETVDPREFVRHGTMPK